MLIVDVAKIVSTPDRYGQTKASIVLKANGHFFFFSWQKIEDFIILFGENKEESILFQTLSEALSDTKHDEIYNFVLFLGNMIANEGENDGEYL